MSLVLYDYQQEIADSVYKLLPETKWLALQLPTGSGKTEIAIDLIKRFLRSGKKCLFVVRSVNLVNQTYDRFVKHFPLVGIIRAKDRRRSMDSLISIMSIDTYIKHKDYREIPELDDASFVVIDEAHDLAGDMNEYLSFVRLKCKDKLVLGLSATFQRIGKKGHKIWNAILYPLSGEDLRLRGRLPDLKILAPKIHYSTAGVSVNPSGDYSSNQIMKRLDADKHFYNDFIKVFKEHGLGKNSIIFCCNIAHTKQVQSILWGIKGLNPVIYHSALPTAELSRQRNRLDFLRERKMPFTIINVNMLSRGVDIPEIDIGFLIRPTASEVLYRQIVGRLTRGKKPVTLIDLTTNSLKFAHPYQLLEPERTNATRLKVQDKQDTKRCELCFVILRRAMFKCNEEGKFICPACNGEQPEKVDDRKTFENVELGGSKDSSENCKSL